MKKNKLSCWCSTTGFNGKATPTARGWLRPTRSLYFCQKAANTRHDAPVLHHAGIWGAEYEQIFFTPLKHRCRTRGRNWKRWWLRLLQISHFITFCRQTNWHLRNVFNLSDRFQSATQQMTFWRVQPQSKLSGLLKTSQTFVWKK